MITRRHFTSLTATTVVAAALSARASIPMRILASPDCGCCHAWADLARARGFAVTFEDLTAPEAQKSVRGIPLNLASCHTSEAGSYVFEGHVPFEALEAVLKDRPNITGLSVPGMSMGSPGMGDEPTARFDVIAFGGKAGAGTVYYRAGTAQPLDT